MGKANQFLATVHRARAELFVLDQSPISGRVCFLLFNSRGARRGRRVFPMIGFFRIFLLLALSLWVVFGLGTIGHAHSGIVDGYGCHRARDKVTYHCHQGQFVGKTFKSREDFLRQLRGGKAEQLSPKNNQPQVEKKIED